MIPIPTPERLIGRRLHNPRSPPPGERPLLAQAAEGVFLLGLLGLLIAAAIIFGSLASEVSDWLALPAGALGVWAVVVIGRRAKPLAGALEAVLYGGLVGSLHSEGQDPSQFSGFWITGAVVALLFAWASYTALKPRG